MLKSLAVTKHSTVTLLLSNLATVLAILYMYSRKRGGMVRVATKLIFSMVLSAAKSAPGTGGLIKKENDKIVKKLTAEVVGDLTGEVIHKVLPETGVSQAEVLKLLRHWNERDRGTWAEGKVSGCVYHGKDDLTKFLSDAQGLFLLSNPLHPDVFPMVRKMESEIVAMVVQMFRGDKVGACGTVTSGGTESILMACRAAKIHAQRTLGIADPEMVIPETAHAAFWKAGEYFSIKVIRVPVHPVTREADVAAMAKAVNANTCLLVASAPCYPSGTVDPVSAIAAIGAKRRICVHVDCCLGSLLMPCARDLGEPLPDFDFAIPGVTSISCDTHKFGYAPKGTSVIMYRTPELRRCQYFLAPEWQGGIYASPSVAGSRPGAVSAATWAGMVHLGRNGYMQIARELIATAKAVEAGIKDTIPDLKILGIRHLSVVGFQTSTPSLNIHNIGDCMKKRGWNLNTLQYPAAIHLCVTHMNAATARAQFVNDLRGAVEEVKTAPPGTFKDGSAAIYGMAESIPDKSIVGDLASAFIDALFLA